MPQPFNSAIMTNGGAQLLTKAQAGKVKIEFTKIEIGDGIYTAEEKTLDYLQEQTGLKSFRNNYPISDVEIYNEYSVKVTALITNQDPVTGGTLIDSGFYINEMGLYAKEKDGTDDTEVLYSIAVTSGENGDFMPPFNGYNPAQITQDYFATVNNSAEVTIQSSGAVALAEDLVEVRKEIEQLKRNGSAGAYSTEIEYHEGEYCLYNNILYKCTKDTQGEWDPKCWVQTNPMEEIMSLRTSLNSLASLFGTDEKGNMRQLGEAAFAGISHNFLTEPENNMVAGADLLKLLKDQVDEQNSASFPENSYIFTRVISVKSFSDAISNVTVDIGYMTDALDKMDTSMTNYESGIHSVSSTSQTYYAILCKRDNTSYTGILMSHYSYNPIFFAKNNNGFILFVPIKANISSNQQ